MTPELRESCSGGVVFHNGSVLILQKHKGDWVLPKGHIELGESATETALREVLEETGIQARALAPLRQTRYRFHSNGFARDKTVSWFLMETDDPSSLCPERYFRRVQFVPLAEALRLLTFASDRGLLAAAQQLREPNVAP